jgi:hypothetical protein
MPSDELFIQSAPSADDQKPFGMTVAEWHLAAGSFEVAVPFVTLYLVSIDILEITVLSALGTSFLLPVGIAMLVMGTLEALGMPVPQKAVQTAVDLVGGPFSLVGGAIGSGLNGQDGLEQGIRLGAIFDVTSADYDAFSSLINHASAAEQILSGGSAVFTHLNTAFPSLQSAPSTVRGSATPGLATTHSQQATERLHNLTQQLTTLAADPSAVRQQLSQTFDSNDYGDRWTHPNPFPLATVPIRQPAPVPIPPPPPTKLPSTTPSPLSTPDLPQPNTPAVPYENSSGEDDEQGQMSVQLP